MLGSGSLETLPIHTPGVASKVLGQSHTIRMPRATWFLVLTTIHLRLIQDLDRYLTFTAAGVLLLIVLVSMGPASRWKPLQEMQTTEKNLRKSTDPCGDGGDDYADILSRLKRTRGAARILFAAIFGTAAPASGQAGGARPGPRFTGRGCNLPPLPEPPRWIPRHHLPLLPALRCLISRAPLPCNA